MDNFLAFINAIIIGSSVLSSVSSLPTQQGGAGLDSTLPNPAPTPTCFEPYLHPYSNEVRSIKEYAVDSEGQSCFELYKGTDMERLLDKNTFERNYANMTAEACPTWHQFSQCFRDHVNSDKCSADDRKNVIASEFLNIHIILDDLVCNPLRTRHFKNLWKQMLSEGIWDCVYGDGNSELVEKCDAQKFDEQGRPAPFQDLGMYFKCMEPGVRNCANEDDAKGVKMVRLWLEYERTLQDTHKAFWK